MMLEKIFAISAMLFSLTAVAMKKNWHIFALSAIANLLTCCSFFVLGGAVNGMIISLVGGIQCITATVYAIKDKSFSLKVKICFFVLYTTCGIMNIKAVYDILPLIASMLCMMALFQKNTQRVRLFNVFNSLTWIAYDSIVGSTAVYSQLLFCVMNLTMMIKYRKQII